MNGKMTWEQAVVELRRDPTKASLVWDSYFDDPLPESAARFHESEEWKEIQSLLKGKMPGRVLDVGAGRGIASYAFSKDGCCVTALEPDPSPVVGAGAIRTMCKEAGCSIEVVEKEGARNPFSDSSFDIVYGRAVLHHIGDLSSFFREVNRLLVKDGAFIFTREHVISRKEDLQSFLDSHPLHHAYGGENALLLKEYVDPMLRAGLALTKIIGPFESPINRFPMSNEEFEKMVIDFAARIVPFPVAQLCGKLRWIRNSYGRLMASKTRIPGRLYSFLGEKRHE
jgi:SAM-dependent methyltransferase